MAGFLANQNSVESLGFVALIKGFSFALRQLVRMKQLRVLVDVLLACLKFSQIILDYLRFFGVAKPQFLIGRISNRFGESTSLLFDNGPVVIWFFVHESDINAGQIWKNNKRPKGWNKRQC